MTILGIYEELIAAETLNYNFTDSQKESCAVSLMRDAVEELSLREGICYEDALSLYQL